MILWLLRQPAADVRIPWGRYAGIKLGELIAAGGLDAWRWIFWASRAHPEPAVCEAAAQLLEASYAELLRGGSSS